MNSMIGYAMAAGHILMIEPFYGGSHRQLIDHLHNHFVGSVKVTMTAKKWHWRARTAALHLSQEIPYSTSYRILFASGVLNLAELIALRPDLSGLTKILYLHENQLVYPVQRDNIEQDFQFSYNQILSCLVADMVIFNSKYNMESFLSSINTVLKKMPDYRPKGLPERIRPKCRVLYFPLDLPSVRKPTRHKQETGSKYQDHSSPSDSQSENQCTYSNPVRDTKCEDQSSLSDSQSDDKTQSICSDSKSDSMYQDVCGNKDNQQQTEYSIPPTTEFDNSTEESCDSDEVLCPVASKRLKTGPLHIVWAHRWEHDKDPETFFTALFQLQEAGVDFRVSVMGEQFTDNPEIFAVAKDRLKLNICAWGYQEKKSDFYRVLSEADVAVSTALHEFFGVSMLEAVYFGCYPLCPNRLVYPEIFPKCYLYNTPNQLFKRLKRMCTVPNEVRQHHIQVPVEKYLWENCAAEFYNLFKTEDKLPS